MTSAKTLFSFYFLLLFLTSTAQVAHYPIESDTALIQYVGSGFWEKLEDKNGNLTIEEVINFDSLGKFRRAGVTSIASDSLVKTHWIRFKVKNKMSTVARLAVGSGANLSDFYLSKNGTSIQHFSSGTQFPWREKDGLKKINAIPFELKPGDELLIYIRRHTNSSFHLSSDYRLPIYSTDTFIQNEFDNYQQNALEIPYVYLSFFSGMIFLAGIFNFLIYRAVKNKVNLYFSLFLFGIFMWYSPTFRVIIPRENWLLSEYIHTLADLTFVFLLFFIRHYFSVFKRHPRWDKFLQIFSIVVIAVSIVSRLFQMTSGLANTLIVVVMSAYFVTMLVTLVLCAFQKGTPKRIFFKAVSPLMIFLVVGLFLAVIFNELASSQEWLNVTDYIGGVCIMWAVIIFSKYLFEDYGKQQQKILQVQIEKEREQAEFIAMQKVELEQQVIERTEELNNSIHELKSTQSQLIQSEKMASLGELTAGIAHEIQNPLNFVNNFSEVNTELISELVEEIEKGNTQEVKFIAADIKENSEKINHHGKRADAIVKGMLQHSRSTSGQKESTDINKLVDEYLRLAYHGLRAKDKSFNATLKTNYDNSIGNINIIPQDIGRVILNLITNAFYVVDEKKKSGIANYEPAVIVSTKNNNGNLEFSVRDNGNGISPKVLHKIFQPFFTTKPTGQGTGLGLSLSYDIVKAHGGELLVERKEGEGSTFIIHLPIS